MVISTVCLAFSVLLAVLPASPTDLDYREILRESLQKSPWVGALPPFRDRAAWEALVRQPGMKRILTRATDNLNTRYEPIPDDLYLEYYQNGIRDNYQRAYSRLSSAASDFAQAYLMTADRRYLTKLEELLHILCSMKSWVLPAHDRNHRIFDGKEIHVDLASSVNSWRYAVIYALLKDELDPKLAAELKQQLQRRTLDPVRAMLSGKQKPDWWMSSKSNWNAVCWAGVLGTTLALDEAQEAKIALTDAALRHIGHSLAGFTPDGYCSEGMGYWNYGYGYNLRFAAMILGATGGKIDLMKLEAMRRPGTYPARITIVGDLCPAYADCVLGSSAHPIWLGVRDALANRPSKEWQKLWRSGLIEDTALLSSIPKMTGKPESLAAPERASVFDDAGIAVARPTAPETRMAASFKGGSNDELHNHNDVGSYVIVLDGVPVLFDPGSEVYTARTFSAKRYESKLLNSFGHPVPVIDGKLQKPGKGTRAKLLKQVENADEFLWTLDLAAAYQLAEIRKLERTFHYLRKAPGSVSVSDLAEFTRPVTFETALVTPGRFEKTGTASARITYKGKTVLIAIDSSAPFDFVPEEIREKVVHKETITRIALRFRKPVTNAQVTILFTPAE